MIIRRKLCLIYRLVTKNPLTGFHEPCISNCPTHNRWIIVFRKSYYASLRNYFTNTNDKKINRTIVRNVIVTRNQQTQKTNLFRPNNRSSLKCYEKKKRKKRRDQTNRTIELSTSMLQKNIGRWKMKKKHSDDARRRRRSSSQRSDYIPSSFGKRRYRHGDHWPSSSIRTYSSAALPTRVYLRVSECYYKWKHSWPPGKPSGPSVISRKTHADAIP